MAPARDPGPRPRPALSAARTSEGPARGGASRASRARSRGACGVGCGPPRTLRPTRAGWVFFALTLGVGIAALNTGNNLMYMVLSLLLSFLVLSGVMSESALRGIQVRRVLPAELVAEQEAIVGVEVANQQRRVPAFAVVVEDVMRQGGTMRPAGRAFALRVAPQTAELRSYRFTPGETRAARVRGLPRRDALPLRPVLEGALDRGAARCARLPGARRGAARRAPERRAPARRVGAPGRPARARSPRACAATRRATRTGACTGARRCGAACCSCASQEQESTGEHLVRLRTAGCAAGAAFEDAVRRAASDVAANLRSGLRVALHTDAAAFGSATAPPIAAAC